MTAELIARQHTAALGAPHTQQARSKGELLELTDDAGRVVAFAAYHFCTARPAGQITIYQIAVAADQQGQGWGRRVLAALLKLHPTATHLLARCPVDLPANGWYAALGFVVVEVERSDTPRPLNVWRLELPTARAD